MKLWTQYKLSPSLQCRRLIVQSHLITVSSIEPPRWMEIITKWWLFHSPIFLCFKNSGWRQTFRRGHTGRVTTETRLRCRILLASILVSLYVMLNCKQHGYKGVLTDCKSWVPFSLALVRNTNANQTFKINYVSIHRIGHVLDTELKFFKMKRPKSTNIYLR